MFFIELINGFTYACMLINLDLTDLTSPMDASISNCVRASLK